MKSKNKATPTNTTTEELEMLFALTKDIVIIASREGKILNANRAFFDFFAPFESIQEFNEKNLNIYETLFDENSPSTLQTSFKKTLFQRNKKFIFEVQTTSLHKQKNSSIIIMRDISAFETKELLARQLEKQQQNYKELETGCVRNSKVLNFIFNAQPEILILTDGTFLKDTNKAMLNFFKYKSLDEFHKRHDCVCDFFEEGDGYLQAKNANGESWIEYLISNIEHTAKVKMKNAQGESRIFKVSTSTMSIEENVYLITFSDITEYLLKESILISKSKKALLGDMINSIVHQWRQPLSTIKTYMTTLQIQLEMGKLTDQKIQSAIESVNVQTEHMNQTIDEFRNFFKPHNTLENVYVKDLINSVLYLIKDELIHNRVSTPLFCESFLKIECVPSEFKHVLLNVIHNAKDAFEENGVTENRTIRIHSFKNKNSVNIVIEDNAGGIDEKIINRVFNEDFTTKLSDKGTGIGLYMSKMIIEKIHGNISVKNNKEGATFTIIIPSQA